MFLFKNSARLRQIQLATGLVLLLCCLQQTIAGQAELQPWSADNRADEFTLPDLKDQQHSLSDYRGKVVLVNFWASWCLPCILEMPELTQLKQHIDWQPFAAQSFEILAINVGERKNRVKQFASRINFKLPVLLDISSEVFNAWNIKIMPTSFLIDASGQVRYRVLGNPGWDNAQTLSLIEDLIKEIKNPDNTKH